MVGSSRIWVSESQSPVGQRKDQSIFVFLLFTIALLTLNTEFYLKKERYTTGND